MSRPTVRLLTVLLFVSLWVVPYVTAQEDGLQVSQKESGPRPLRPSPSSSGMSQPGQPPTQPGMPQSGQPPYTMGGPQTGQQDGDFQGSLGKGGHKRYVPSLSNPFVNETPYITTEIRPIYMYHNLPDNIPAAGVRGGNINLWAVQLRVALSQRFGFILNKSGWADVNLNVPGMDDDAFTNLGFGFKYALVDEPRQGSLITAGLTYEAPSGGLKAGGTWLQGNGEGFLSPFFTALETTNKVSVQALFGAKFALDRDANTSFFHYALHMDYEMVPGFFPLVEFNGFIPIDEGNRTPYAFEGLDLFSTGAENPASVITFAAGSRFKLGKNLLAGVAYEIPLTDDEDILDWRLTADLVIRY